MDSGCRCICRRICCKVRDESRHLNSHRDLVTRRSSIKISKRMRHIRNHNSRHKLVSSHIRVRVIIRTSIHIRARMSTPSV